MLSSATKRTRSSSLMSTNESRDFTASTICSCVGGSGLPRITGTGAREDQLRMTG